MSRKPHQIVQNDVRFSALPEHTGMTDRGVGAAVFRSTGQARTRQRADGPLVTALPADAIAVGLYRTDGEDACPSDVRVLSNGSSFFITEAEYRRRECRPFFEDLPWNRAADGQPTGRKR